jgi:catechol 2,3-dioxygenase-like lactoylglutathione lyase family enzyme
MIDTIGGAVIIVSDQQKAIEFYTQKLGFELKSDIPFGGDTSSTESLRWVEVAPKQSQSTISLMVPNPMMMSDGVEIEAIKKSIEQKLEYGFIQKICNQPMKNSKEKELILLHLKSKNGEVLCPK